MVPDGSLVEKIAGSRPSWSVLVQKREFVPDSVEIAKSAIPVKKPDTRGGVYFSETEAYKVKCLISEPAVTSLLTPTMLGPSAEFTPIEITATLDGARYLIRANLTGYVQTRAGTQLNLVVVDVSS